MSSATMTLIGLYSYDSTLFDGLDLPETIQSDLLVDSILMRGGEYEVVYSNGDFMKQAITSWSKRWKPVFTEWCRAFEDMQEVAPLENYDRIENWSDSASSSEHTSTSQSEVSSLSTSEISSLSTSEVSSGSSSTSGSDSSHGSESMSERGDVSAYDSSTLVANDGGTKSASTNSNTLTYTLQGSSNTSQGMQQNASQGAQRNNRDVIENFNKNNTDYSVHGGRVHGNIGVTTSAQLYESWVATLENAGNLYEKITTVFLQNFVIPLV